MKKKSIAARLGVVALALTLATTSLSSGTLAKFATTGYASGLFTVASWNVGAKITDVSGNTTWTATSTEALDIDTIASYTVALSEHATTPANKDSVANDEGKYTVVAPGMSGQFGILVTNQQQNNADITDVETQYEVYIRKVQMTGFAVADNAPAHFVLSDITGATDGEEGLAVPIVRAGLNWDEDVLQPTATENVNEETGLGDADSSPYADLIYSDEYGVRLASGTMDAGKKQEELLKIQWKWPYEGLVSDDAEYDAKDNEAGTETADQRKVQFEIVVRFTQVNPEESPAP